MESSFSRTQLLFGKDNMDKLSSARVLIFGVGGVGGYVAEGLARSGIGALDIVDDDKVCLSNLNRQIIALHSTIGMYKVDVAKARIHDINPDCKVTAYRTFFMPDTANQFDFSQYDYVVDCIDTVTGKIQIVMQARECNVAVISCMGAGNKVDPTQLEVADISNTSVCPLARVMRRELKNRGVEHLKVVYSKEIAIQPLYDEKDDTEQKTDDASALDSCHAPKKQSPGSTSFVPSVAGLIIAGEVVKDITGFHKTEIKIAKNAKKKTSKSNRTN